MLESARWKRLVILGDGIAEGVNEAVPGYPSGSWVDQVSDGLKAAQSDFAAFNLGRRNLLASEVRITQLTPALELQPDLAFIAAGVSDIRHRDFNCHLVRSELTVMVSALRAAGADVLTVNVMPELVTIATEVTAKFGGILCDPSPQLEDASAWSAGSRHLNARGHAIVVAKAIRALSAFISG